MATFIQTTLDKRTGSTTTVFNPMGISGGVATMRESSAYTWIGRFVTMSSLNTGNARRTKVRVNIPQVASDGVTVNARPWAQIELFIPEGVDADDVNDLVGYIESFCSSSLTNADDILVGGVGIY
jgi:hypothetical protein